MTKKRKGWVFGFACLLVVICIALCGWFAAEKLLDKSTDIRIVLTWGAEPADLELELTGTVPGTGEPFTLNYEQKELEGYAWKDVDDRSSYGPETITITKRFDAPVICTVRDFTNRNDAQSTALSESEATVKVIKNSKVIATYTVEAGQTATSWTVFQLMPNGKIEPINTYAAPEVTASDVSAPTPVVIDPAQFAADDINIVLSWGVHSDLDLSLSGINPYSGETVTLKWNRKFIGEYAEFVVDSRTLCGMECIVVHAPFDTPYICTVSDYINREETVSTALAESGAKVDVYKGSELIATFTPNAGQPATKWNVFQLMPDGKIEPINTYEAPDVSAPDSPAPTPETHIPADFGADEYHVVMKWHDGVGDLDLQISGTKPGTDEPFTVNWETPELTGYAALSDDERGSRNASETICISQPFDAPITCTVLDMVQRHVNTWVYEPMDESNITVEVYKGSELIASFASTPGHSGMMRWDVCQLMPDGSVVAIDTYSDTGLPAPYRVFPPMDDVRYPVGLTWNDEVVEDLDLHLIGYTESWNCYFHLSQKDPDSDNYGKHDNFVAVASPSEEESGFEAICMKRRPETPTLVTVHDYTNHANSESSALSDSEAFVWVLDDSWKKVAASFTVQPGMTGNEWAVCWLMPDGSILPVDEYLPGTDAANVGKVVYERGVQ